MTINTFTKENKPKRPIKQQLEYQRPNLIVPDVPSVPDVPDDYMETPDLYPMVRFLLAPIAVESRFLSMVQIYSMQHCNWGLKSTMPNYLAVWQKILNCCVHFSIRE